MARTGLQLQTAFLVLLLAGTAFPQKSVQEMITLHPAVGPVIDADENARYNLFSLNMGLRQARLYRTRRGNIRLHLLGEKDGRPWISTPSLSETMRIKMHLRVQEMVRAQNGGHRPPESAPLFRITLPEEIGSAQPVRVELVDGTTLLGHLRGLSGDEIVLQTLGGVELTIPENQVWRVSYPRGKLRNGSFLPYGPNHVRLFFAPTGRTLKRGEGSFSDFYVFFPTLTVGITDFFMLGGGVSMFPGSSTQLLYFSPKLRLAHTSNLDWAAGFLFVKVPEEGVATGAFTALSLGSPLGGVTLGAALPLGGDATDFRELGLLFGAETQVSRHVKLITENWWWLTGDESTVLLSGGFRLMGERLAVDLALATATDILDEGGFPFIPYVAFAVNFGK
ncbi:MAG: hypothetical protein D6743_15600 [Calditrichaeota bacterium]|nr:MAG: hypothetical protein D6743_15600 [Calditrichota bacterium]